MGVIENLLRPFRRVRPEAPKEDIKLADFGIITNGSTTERVNFDQAVGSITPEEAERLKLNTRGTGNLSITLDGYIEQGIDSKLDKEDDEWLYEFWKMRQDDTVQDALNYLLSFLHTQKYYVEPASEDPEDLEIAAFVADSLGLDGKRAGKYPFQRIIKSYEHALLYRRSAGEIVLTLGEDNKLLMDKFIPIHPFNIEEIIFDSRGGPRSIHVVGQMNNERQTRVDKRIPIWKTVLFVNDDEGDFRGQSILQGAWLPWKIKRAMLQLVNAGFERFLLGIPIMKLPKGITRGSKEWEEAKQTLTKFAMKPRTGMMVPDGYEFDIQVVNNQMPDALPYIRMMDEAIYKSMGMTFSTMGRGDNSSGTYTVGAELSQAATRNVQRISKQFIDYINAYLVPKLVMVNWPDVTNYPTLQVTHLHGAEAASILNAFGQMISVSMSDGGFNPETYRALIDVAPSKVRDILGIDADRRKELVDSRRRSVR